MSLPLQDALEGKYEILEKIGEGGIGAVYKVRHRLLEEIRVIKVLRPQAASKEDLRQRFLQEARMAIQLKHPNIAQLHDFSISEDDRAYIVMEYIEGVSLDALLEAAGPPSVDLVLEIARQGLSALDYLHQQQFVHRDVSPDNLMLTSSFDGSPLVKLIDLGIARHVGAEARLTATGVFLGKARYCSPEQFSAGGETDTEVDQRGDIYSFGVMLYELLTGVYPFAGESFAELAGSHLFQPPRDFAESDFEGRLPEGLRAAVLRALEKSPDDRFASAADFAAELAPFQNPAATFREEFDRTVEITTASLPKVKAGERPGSTQNRLNREFGLDTTPAPDRRLADELLGKTVVADSEAAARRQRTALAGERSRTAVLVGLAAMVLTAAALTLWWWQGRQPRPPAPAGNAIEISLAPRWRPPEAVVGIGADLELPPPEAAPPSGAGDTQGPSAPVAAQPSPAEPAKTADSATAEPDSTPAAAVTEALELSQEIFAPEVGVVPPVLLELPPPQVPAGGRRLREELLIVVEVLVDETGRVLTARVTEGPSFRRRYRDAALEAAREARFRPARKGNTLGRMWTQINVSFAPD